MATSKRKQVKNDLSGIVITQSNRVSSAKYDYSLLQERVFNMVMYHLQVYVKQVMDGKSVRQLDLFAQQQNTHIINLPLWYISTPDHYSEVREVCEKMATIPIVITDHDKKIRTVTGLLTSVRTSFENTKRVNKISLEMRNDVTALLLHIDRNSRNQPAQYTQYLLSVVMQARNKYTSKIYKYLCSWKNKGGVRMSVDELREILQLPDNRYKNFADLKRFVLLPVQAELKQMADLWYNCASPGFAECEENAGKRVQWLNFKIIVPVSHEFVQKKIEALKWNLRTSWKCTVSDVSKLDPYLNNDTDWSIINDVLDKCYIYRQDNNITYPNAYVIRALLNSLTAENTP